MESQNPLKIDGGKDPHSTVLLVDSRGKVRTLKNFGRTIKLIAGFIGLSIVVWIVMGFFYTRLSMDNASLKSDLSALQIRLDQAKKENELLMARVVIAESSSPKAAKPGAGVIKTEAGDPVNKQSAPAREVLTAQSAAVTQAKASPPAPKPPPKPRVEVGNFEARFQEDRSRLEVTYTLKNLGSTKAEGRSVAVLTTDATGKNSRLPLPRVWLEDGKPRGNRGRRFSIRRFMRVNMDREVDAPGARIKEAEVFIFADSGEMLTRKTFPLDLKLPEKKPSSPTPSPAEAAAPENTSDASAPVPETGASDVLGTLGSGADSPAGLPAVGSPDPAPAGESTEVQDEGEGEAPQP